MTGARGRATALCLAVTLGCAAAPLGDDWEGLATDERDARALEALRELFAFRVDGVGDPVADREVLRVDLQGITYETDEGTSRLRWVDIEAVEKDEHPGLPARPVDLRLHLRRESPSHERVKDQVEPALASTGLFRRYLLLRMRPRASRARLLAALDHVRLRGATVASPGPVAPLASATPAAVETHPPAGETRLDEVEGTLRRLRAWRDEGLITEEEYEAKRRALVEGL